SIFLRLRYPFQPSVIIVEFFFICFKTIFSMVSRFLVCTISKNHRLEVRDILPMHHNRLKHRPTLYFLLLKQLSSTSLCIYTHLFFIFSFINNEFYKINNFVN
ncbi:hypothetical protein SLOPH_2581, partial [Spraguea lophii 42_110]